MNERDGSINQGGAQPAQNAPSGGPADLREALTSHPMYCPSDLKYLREKGHSDREILTFWDRDHGMGCSPADGHRFTYSGTLSQVLRDVLRDNLSPQAVAAIAMRLRSWPEAPAVRPAVAREVKWLAEQLVAMLGGQEQYERLADETAM